MKKLLITLVLILLTSIAFAADLDPAKRHGLVGERADGYLGLVDASAAPDIISMVAEVNDKRKTEYQRIAMANDLSLEEVQALAGKKAIAKTEPGNWILRNGGWERK